MLLRLVSGRVFSSVFFVSILDGLGPCWFEQALLPRPKEQWMYYRIAMSAPKVVFIVCIKKKIYIYTHRHTYKAI